MAALSADRNTVSRSGDLREFPVKGSTLIYAGALTVLDSSGRALPMYTATGLVGVGRAEHRADNSNGGDGASRVRVGSGIYRFDNSTSGDLITTADIGATCYGVDDHTVAKTNGSNTRSPAGTIHDVDAQGVWVRFY